MKCKINGCSGATTRYGRYCSAHQSRRRRHGHPLQEAVCVQHIAPYIPRIRQRVAKNAESPLWPLLESRWSALTDQCRAYMAQPVFIRWQRKAAEELLNIHANVPVRAILETVAAMFYLQDDTPWAIRDDNAMRVQVARRVRGLTDLNAGTTYDHRRRKVRRVYRELTPRASAAFGQWVIDALGLACLRIVKMEKEERTKIDQEKTVFRNALGTLQ